MVRVSRWKIALVLIATVFAIVFSLPNLFGSNTPSWLPGDRLNLGLDLQGGSYLLLEVDTDALARERVTNLIEDARRELREDRIAYSGLSQRDGAVSVQINDAAQYDVAFRALSTLNQVGADGQNQLDVTRQPGQRIRMAYTAAATETDARRAVDQSIEVIRRRVDALGTREPSITRLGENRIVVQAPGESDPERLKRVIGQTARLTFQMVDDSVPVAEAQAGNLPPGTVLLPQPSQPSEPFLVLQRRALVTGEMLTSASPGFDQQRNIPIVEFAFNTQGARAFGRATSANVNERFAIVLDDRIISAPSINEPITGGRGQISGNFTVESANELALLLRAGALPAPLNVEEQRTVGAELGADAVRAGVASMVVAMALVVVFMILAYGFLFGGISVVALVVNGLLIVASMSLTGASLTLPGIAGLILSLAVAVDANVLIYERMRDEVRAGKTVIQAMDAGFSRAMLTIIDANLTTLVAALIMFVLGAGPVKGFAWTLTIGVFTSVFTAVLITQVLLALWFRMRRPKSLPIS